MSDIEVTMAAKNEASKVLRDFRSQVEQDTRAVELSFQGMVQGLGIGVMVTGINKAIESIVEFGKQSVAVFDKAADSTQKLAESLSVFTNNGAIDFQIDDASVQQLTKLASELERVTNVSDTAIKKAMAGAVRDGASIDELDDMTRAAVGLARVFDTDVAVGMARVRSAVEGNLGPFKSLEELTRAAEQGLRNAMVAADDSSQSQRRLSIEWENFQEAVGRAIDPLRDFASEGLLVVTNAIRQHVLPALESMEDIISDGITVAAAIGEAAIENFAQIAQVSFDTVALGLETLRSQFEFVFTEAIVGYLEYFGREAADMASVVYKVFDNLGYNISNAIVRARSSPEVAKQLPFRDLTDMGDVGFMGGGAAPDLSQGRKVSDFERQLRERLTGGFTNLFEDLYRTIEERLSQNRQRQRDVPNIDPINLQARGGVGEEGRSAASSILSAVQSDILRFGPTAPAPDKMEQLQREANTKLDRMAVALENLERERNAEIRLVPVN